MRNFKVKLSLRYKLLFLLTALPVVSLGLYLAMAADLFQKDKVAYVFDSSATVSRSLATETRTELQAAYASLRVIAEHYDFNQRQFGDVGKDLFTKNSKVQALLLFRREADGQYTKLGQLNKDGAQAQSFVANIPLLTKLRDLAVENALYVNEAPGRGGAVSLSFRLGEKTDPGHMVIMALYQADDMVDAFNSVGLYSNLILTRQGLRSIGSEDASAADLEVLRDVLHSSANDGAAERKMENGASYLISFATVGLGDLVVVSKVDKAKALKAVEVLLTKSILFFVALIAITLLISVFAANRLTSALRELFDATTKIAQGDFSVRVKPRSDDEVGGLTQSFNYMAGEVSRLIQATAQKARMESELATVKAVQETLFPPAQSQFGPLRIMGHFEPASECGGDWWNYSRVGNKIFIWIGDVTGHGAPAALLTSAARSAAAVIEGLPDMTPGKAMSIMNRAIQRTSKGQIMMTFFLASIDLEENTFTYACASHDPPYLLRHTGNQLTRKDLQPLNEVNGPRLGDQKEFIYPEVTLAFNPGDMLFFYTDGIMDVESPDRRKLGERAFLKSVLESANMGKGVDSKVNVIRKSLEDHRQGQDLIDDVTIVVCEYEMIQRAAA
jgi:sigma-B regulation protein RsbU (phosphoserine phosphatase)